MDSFTIQPGQTIHRDLNCGTGNKAVGGGALTQTPFTRVWRSWPDSASQNTWHISVTSFNNVAETVWVRATCATGFVSFENFAGSTGSFATNTFATGTATCDSARTSMGGGFIAPNANFAIVSSHVQGSGWRVRAFNASGASNQVGVIVTCAGSSVGTRSITTQTTTVAPGGAVFPITSCASGQWLASGGFRSTVDTNWTIVTGDLPDSSNFKAWKWNLKNLDTVSHTYDRTLVCFDL